MLTQKGGDKNGADEESLWLWMYSIETEWHQGHEKQEEDQEVKVRRK
jgi:hypothetical protein